MFRHAGQGLGARMKRLVASQDAVGKIRMTLHAFLPASVDQASVQEVEYDDGIVVLKTASKSLAAHLLMQTGQLRSALKTEGVRVSRIVVR